MSIVTSSKVKCDNCGTLYTFSANGVKEGCKITYHNKCYDVCYTCASSISGFIAFLSSLEGNT